MTRTENDTWDLASSVGATATMVAAARAIATAADDALINDPFAEPLVRAVGVDFFTRLATGDLLAEDLDADNASVGMQRMTDNMAVRTKFFDEFFLTATGGGNPATATGGGNPATATGGGNPATATGGGNPATATGGGNPATATGGANPATATGGANPATATGGANPADATASGVRQAVILASGLDARAYRLQWPAGTTVYEIDQPEVIEFKSTTLAEFGAEPTADRRTVAMDLRYDWPSALIAAGFDPSQPTAWSAEGLLGYLPPEAQDRLLDTITELSAVGSWVAVESVPTIDPAEHEKAVERMREASERWRSHGFDLDFANLVYLGDRNEPAGYLEDHGWQLTRQSVAELLAANGLPPLDEDDEEVANFGELQYVSGILKS